MPRWVPDVDMLGAPTTSLLLSLVSGLFALGLALTAPLLGPTLCGLSSLFVLATVLLLATSVLPRFAQIRGPELVLHLTPTHLAFEADWPGVPGDQLTGLLAGMDWKHAGGERIPWAELRGARLSKHKTHLELKCSDGQMLRLPVGGSRRWDKTLGNLARELDEHCQRVSSGRVPRALDALRGREPK